MMARLRGFLWLLAGIVVALLAGFVAFQTLSRAAEAPTATTEAGPTVQIVVATRPVALRTAVAAEDVEVRDVPVDSAPEGAVRSTEDAVGRLTLVDLVPGEPLLAQRLLDPNVIAGDGRLALFMVEDEVLMAVPAQDLLGRIGVLKPGDHVDILFSADFPVNRAPGMAAENTEEQATFNLLQNVTVAALVGGQPSSESVSSEVTAGEDNTQTVVQPEAVLLTLNPQDVLALKYVIDAGGTLDFVLRPPGVDRPYDVDPVDVDYLIDRYDIPNQVGR